MTDGNPDPFEPPAPPASTGWSREPAAEDDGLAPPFIPGAPSSEPAAPPVEAEAVEAERVFAEPADTPAPYEPAHAAEPEDDFPFEAFDIEGDEPARAAPPAPGAAEAATGAAAELADRLEALAGRLRAGGAEAIEAEMSSDDRFTGLLAGLLAGYLAGRE